MNSYELNSMLVTVRRQTKRVREADASRYHGKAPDETDCSALERQTRAVSEFLVSLDNDDRHADRKPPKVISPNDHCSAWTAKANKRVQRVQFGNGLTQPDRHRERVLEPSGMVSSRHFPVPTPDRWPACWRR